MKTLYLLRHGKAGWGDPGTSDHERPLETDGVIASRRLGLHMVRHKILPDIIFNSSAKRVRETRDAMLSAVSHNWPHETMDEIYNAGPSELMKIIYNANNTHEKIMVIGHNPTLHEVAYALVGSGDENLRNALTSGYASGTIAGIEFDVERWQDIKPSSGTLIHLDSPDEMPEDF